ncbi:demethylmenaquinone methyltransferase [Alicyclobacillus tolerans]|uniref:Demethylmenaquinone methyltransferase n=1 Tax=Alicyclobacillus tolerans TaxID=90970 RepID=A0A1M6XC04_9BACL|nr:demethylmenaquinone methyltransferase [Alicyclobacillus montanus]SHL03463.1 demethylmenaquinone methyltransferase / 2-methoxy-6-polyprenyl-1,4-benzoquinol methylase [Alicyclobacillus montanus]
MKTNVSKADYVHEVFSQIADRYDFMNSVLSFQQHHLWRRFTMKKLKIQPGAQVLDVAAGTGAWTFSLAEAVGPKGKVIGLDFCKEMLDVGRERKIKMGQRANHIEFIEGDAMQLPFLDNSFDAVTIGFALRNVPDIHQCLREMRRVVKPGGHVVSLELSKPESTYFRKLYYFYFYNILPKIGYLAVGKKAPYAWLPESLTNFPNRLELEHIFHEVGLVNVKSYALTGGIAALHMGEKGEEPNSI